MTGEVTQDRWGNYTPGPWGWRGAEELVPGLRMADALVGPERVHPSSVTKEPEPTSVISVNGYSDNLVVGNADARLISKAYLIPRLEQAVRIFSRHNGLDREHDCGGPPECVNCFVTELLAELRSL